MSANDNIQLIYEKIMNKDTLRLLPRLLDDMDQNLSIPIDKFINNPVIVECRIDKAKLIEVVKNSKEYHYDKKLKVLRFKRKADLNILIVEDFIFLNQETEVEDIIQDKLMFLRKTLLLSCNTQSIDGYILSKDYLNFPSKLRKIQYIDETKTFQIIFDNESWSSLASNFLEEIAASGYFTKHLVNSKLKVSSAAETLKRRILYDLPLSAIEACTVDRQIKIVKDIVKDPNKFDANKFLVDCVYKPGDKENIKNKHPNYQRPSLSLVFQYQSNNLSKIKARLNSTNIRLDKCSIDKKRLFSVRNSVVNGKHKIITIIRKEQSSK